MFRCESEHALFGLQWLSCIYDTDTRTVKHKYSSVCSAFYRGLFPDLGE